MPERGGPSAEDMGLSNDEIAVEAETQQATESDEPKPAVVKAFERLDAKTRVELGARDDEPVAVAWFRKMFGKSDNESRKTKE